MGRELAKRRATPRGSRSIFGPFQRNLIFFRFFFLLDTQTSLPRSLARVRWILSRKRECCGRYGGDTRSRPRCRRQKDTSEHARLYLVLSSLASTGSIDLTNEIKKSLIKAKHNGLELDHCSAGSLSRRTNLSIPFSFISLLPFRAVMQSNIMIFQHRSNQR